MARLSRGPAPTRRALGSVVARTRLTAIVWTAAFLTAACTQLAPPNDDAEPATAPVRPVQVGSTRQALIGEPDPDSPAASAVVKLTDGAGLLKGSGLLITPRLVLTAGHVATIPNLQAEVWGVTYLVVGAASLSTGVPTNQTGRDVGLLRLQSEPSDLTYTSSKENIASILARRPGFTSVGLTSDQRFSFPIFGAAFGSDARERGAATSLVYDFFDAYWTSTPTTQKGDSGGPLYAERSDGSRDPIGVISGYAAGYGYGYAKLSRPDVIAFIKANAVDTSPSALWFRRHGKIAGDHWYGETDYVGPCDPARDTDCDHWYNEHDNCPRVDNVLQTDGDDDGVGDACDSCIEAYNPGQDNCNQRAEAAENPRHLGGVRTLGDVCDPIPCARAEAAETTKLDEVCVPATAPFQGQECTATPVSDAWHVTALGSYPVSGGGRFPAPRVVRDVPTEFRFCQNISRGGLDIQCDRPLTMLDARLLDPEVPDDPRRPWHRVTIGARPYAEPATWTYGETVTPLRWSYRADAARWFAGGQQLVPLPDGCSGDPSKCLDGVFWVHAKTDAGRSERFGSPANLTNRYEPVHPEAAAVSYCPLPAPELAWLDPPPPPRKQLAAEIAVPGFATFRKLGLGTRGATLVVPTYSEAGVLRGPAAMLRDDGSLVGATSSPGCGEPRLDTGLAERFRELAWASVVEPSPNLGGMDPDLVAVGLDGPQVVRSVAMKEGALVEGPPVSLGGGEPPPREAPLLVLSRVAGGLFLLGGDGTDDRTVYFHPIHGRWEKTPYELPEGQTAVAATFGFADHMLWIVLQDGSTGKLVRADLSLGVGHEVATFGLGETARPHLSVDRDGSVILARGGDATTDLVRFVPVGTKVQAEHLSPVAGRTIRGPLVDASVYTFVQRSAAGTRSVHHEASLSVAGARLKCPQECEGVLP